MEPYLFIGTVSPERAQITDHFAVGFKHVSSEASGHAKVSILLNNSQYGLKAKVNGIFTLCET
jgi:hypothetical protein